MRNPNPLLEHVFLCKNEAKTNLWIHVTFQKPEQFVFSFTWIHV
jgi:hypothetical protein